MYLKIVTTFIECDQLKPSMTSWWARETRVSPFLISHCTLDHDKKQIEERSGAEMREEIKKRNKRVEKKREEKRKTIRDKEKKREE